VLRGSAYPDLGQRRGPHLFYVEEGLPQTQVLRWVSGEQLRAVFENAVLVEYHGRYDWRDRKITDIREGVFYPTRFASPQGRLMPLTPQGSGVVYRVRPRRRRAPRVSPAPQLLLFADGESRASVPAGSRRRGRADR
jgi:hypothetical protein